MEKLATGDQSLKLLENIYKLEFKEACNVDVGETFLILSDQRLVSWNAVVSA
jgi:hypothetical protein